MEITRQLKEKIENGFILIQKNGKMELEKLPEYGEITIKIQDKKVVNILTTHNEKCS